MIPDYSSENITIHCNKIISVTTVCLIISSIFSGCLTSEENEDEYSDVNIIFSSPMPIGRNASGIWKWDVSVEVMRVLPDDANVRWKDLEVNLTDANGTSLIPPTSPKPDTDQYIGSPEVWYIDSSSDIRFVDADDEIRITSMDLNYQYATITVKANGYDLGTTRLPHTFPTPPI